MELKKISLNIRKIRDFKNITREFIANEMNMSVSGYSKIERGEIDITVLKLQKIACILNVTVYDILNFDSIGIFNNSNNQFVRNLSADFDDEKSNTQKYILMLEGEIERLKVLLS